MNAWNNEMQRAMAHPIRRRIVELLRDADLSFVELLNAVSESNHGKLGYHLRTLKTFVELVPSTNKYRLTDRGRLLDACIRDFRFIILTRKELAQYAQHLRLGDHAVGFYDSAISNVKYLFRS